MFYRRRHPPRGGMNTPVVIVMGVSGSGKSTVGAMLADRLAVAFVDGDAFHDPEAIRQMAEGRALTNAQRHDWLVRVHDELIRLAPHGVVCACSALTCAARDQLVDGLPEAQLVWLHGPPDLIRRRLERRVGHPVGASLLPSQLQALEPPTGAMRIDVDSEPSDLVDEIVAGLIPPADPNPGPPSRMETVLEAVARLRAAGFCHDVTVADTGRLRCRACDAVNEAADMTMEEIVRFEGESNPDDQSILVALVTGCGHRGLYFSAYGPSTPGPDAKVHRSLAAARTGADVSI